MCWSHEPATYVETTIISFPTAMTPDPIIEEIHLTREAILQRFGDDLRAVCADAARRQGEQGNNVVRRPPRPPRQTLAVQ